MLANLPDMKLIVFNPDNFSNHIRTDFEHYSHVKSDRNIEKDLDHIPLSDLFHTS